MLRVRRALEQAGACRPSSTRRWQATIGVLVALVVGLSAGGCGPPPAFPERATPTAIAANVHPTEGAHPDYTRPPVEVNITRPPVEVNGAGTVCAPEWDRPEWLFRDSVQWTPDGSTVLFTEASQIYGVAADGTRLWDVVAPVLAEGKRLAPMAAFTIAPDGEQIVYSTCEYGDSYELARGWVNGTQPERLTQNTQFDNHPAWSPDGERVAFLAAAQVSGGASDLSPRLYTMAADGSNVTLVPSGSVDRWTHVVHRPPQWSPDSQHLAYALRESGGGAAVYVVAMGGGAPRRLADAVSGPSWSPDGERLAFAKPEGRRVELYTFAADGSDAQKVTLVEGWRQQFGNQDPTRAWIETVAWSPSGEHILYTCAPAICVVALDGTGMGEEPLQGSVGAWSPDGSLIAIVDTERHEPNELYRTVLRLVAPNGGSVQALVKRDRAGRLYRRGPHEPVDTVDVAGCAVGVAVPDPDANPELVADCEALLAVQAILADVRMRGWATDRPLSTWAGVSVEGTPLRVRELALPESGLWSVVPPGLGELSALTKLNLSGNQLIGAIPPELGQLVNLETLYLGGNDLTGCIPPALHRVPDNDLAELGLPDCEPG